MGPPRRQTQSATTTKTSQTTSNNSPSNHMTPEPSTPSGSHSPQPASLGMTPASRYDYNLKVLRRRDPSIVSIFDQFSHVCVYHHDGQKWEKHGFEGSMFLFERNSYPPYGLYIMNRVNMEDYVQPLYPEDELVHSGNYLIIRSYPDFLNERLTKINAAYPGNKLDKFSDVYAVQDVDEIDTKSKGRPNIVALWMHADDTRESLVEVMRTLHSYIKKNVSYPEEFRYGPIRPPPPNRLRALPKKTDHTHSLSSKAHALMPFLAGSTSDSQAQRLQSDSENERSYYSDAPISANRGLSTIDRLFSKLDPYHDTTSAPGQIILPESHLSTSFPSSSLRSTGIPLLDDIFASASLSPAPSSSAMGFSNTTVQQPTTILSPQPSIRTPGPQVLDSQTLNTILAGSTPSRASSVVSHPSSREGDNECDSGSRSDSPRTVLDEDSDYQKTNRLPVGGAHRPDLRNSLGANTGRLAPKVKGDVTPRLPLNCLQRTSSAIETSSITISRPANSASAPPPFSVHDASVKPRANRPLVPFESDSEFWPYSTKPAGDGSATTTTTDDDDGDIVELDFEDTSVLNDPDAFTMVLKQKKSAVMLRPSETANGAVRVVNGNGNASVPSEKGKGKNRRRTKRDRDAREKEEIEKSWDLPPRSAVNLGMGMEKVFGAPMSPSVTVLEKPVPPVAEMKTPTIKATTALSSTSTKVIPAASKGKGKMVNGHAKVNRNGLTGGMDPEVVKQSVVHTILQQPQLLSTMDKDEFVRQLTALIRSDNTFVENLYQDYITRA